MWAQASVDPTSYPAHRLNLCSQHPTHTHAGGLLRFGYPEEEELKRFSKGCAGPFVLITVPLLSVTDSSRSLCHKVARPELQP